MHSRRAAIGVCTLFLAAGVAAVAPAEVLGVKLEDSSTNPTIARMRITLDRPTVTAGRVTFEAVNGSKALKHDVVVVRERGTGELPFDPQHGGINEHAVRRLGEIAHLAPGETGKLTLNLGPGTYLLLCDEAGHQTDATPAKLVVVP
jgi:uncharacterized cupredoxin-like copper-binding protein